MPTRLYFILSYIFILPGLLCSQSIINTKHNLSTTGTGTIKASSETQVCVFCHTPHSKDVTTQLWNHQPTTATYTLYSSDYLTSKSYPASTQPGAKSKLCLTCHDGTIAIGAVYNTSGSGSIGSIPLSGGTTVLPSGSSANVGISLVNDHPVGFGYDPTKDAELVSRTWPWTTAIKLDPNTSAGKVECTTCHEPHHNTYSKFLQISNTNAALCTFCHNKTNWTTAIHKTSTQSYTPPGYSATTIGEWACRDCHQSHNGLGVPYLLDLSEESTCYQASCHGSTSPGVNTKDLQTVSNKTYRHPTNSVSGKHKNPDNLTSLNVPNRHAECYDCHNPHQAKKGLHTLKSNAVSNVLTGVWGVTPGTATIWTQPTTFTVTNPITTENQICFKCHSYYGFSTATNGVTTIIGPSGVNITDQAMEFNLANKSAHPIEGGLNSQTGSGTPKPLATAQMATAWNTLGTQTMYCSDCHGNDQLTSATVPEGPHGSAIKFMLRGTTTLSAAQYWPTNAGGTNLWTLRDPSANTNSWSTNLFCVGCHPLYSGGTWKNNAHTEHASRNVTIGGKAYTGIPCVSCHTAVPHGSKRSRLITYNSDVAPFAYRDGTINVNIIWGFKKATGPTSYSQSNCYSTQNGCTNHSNAGGYDP